MGIWLTQGSVCKLNFLFMRGWQWTYSPTSQVCMEIQVHKFKFSKKYFPLVPRVLLLLVFGKIITFLVGMVIDSFCLHDEVATCWAFLLLFLVHGTRRSYSISNENEGFFLLLELVIFVFFLSFCLSFCLSAEKNLTVSLRSLLSLVSITG